MSIPDLSPSYFIGKQGNGVISFGSGQPDLPPPEEIRNIQRKEFRYGPVQGEDKLREALSENYPASDKDSFVITNGASEALDLSLRALALKGAKKVLVPRPYYYSYPELVKFAGLEPVYTQTRRGKMGIEDIREKAKDISVMMINSPSNPTGMIEEMDTLKEIEKLSKQYGFYIISDEVYKDLIYERENYLIEGRRVITVNSFSKTYSMCGERIGYLWSRDKEFVQDVIVLKTHTSMNTNLTAQEKAYHALQVDEKYKQEQLKTWRERRELMYNGLKDMGFQLRKPEGAFYVFPKLENTKQVVWELFNNYGVIVYRGEWFGEADHIRLSYALDKVKMEEGLRIIRYYLKK